MKKTLFAIFLMLVSALFAFGQIGSATNNMSSDKEELLQINREMLEALARLDFKAAAELTTADYFETDERGEVLSREIAFKEYKAEPGEKFGFEIGDVKTRIFGDTAVMSYLLKSSYQYKTHKHDWQYQITDFLVRRDGKWLFAATHYSRLPKMRSAARLDAKTLDKYAGVYEVEKGRNVTVRRDGDKLILDYGDNEPQEWLPESENVFFSKFKEGSIVFEKDKKGNITGMKRNPCEEMPSIRKKIK